MTYSEVRQQTDQVITQTMYHQLVYYLCIIVNQVMIEHLGNFCVCVYTYAAYLLLKLRAVFHLSEVVCQCRLPWEIANYFPNIEV